MEGREFKRLPESMSLKAQLTRWTWIYSAYFGINLDASGIKVPKRKRGFNRLIVVATDDVAKIIEACKLRFGLMDHDREFRVASARDCRSGSYAVWVRNIEESSKGNPDKPIDEFDAQNYETLQERLLHEIIHFLESGHHLDNESRTICAGSWSPTNTGQFRLRGIPTVSNSLISEMIDIGYNATDTIDRSFLGLRVGVRWVVS
jgi:hypothetical protein